MISVQIDKEKFAESLKERFKNITNSTSNIYRQIAFDLVPEIQKRIHIEGLAADGRQIGNYSSAYLKIRTAKKKGAKSKKGFNRNASPEVILSLTRQLENDYAVMATDRGWGVGFNNKINLDKAKWNDKRYGGRTIYDLTSNELEIVADLVLKLIIKEFE